MSLEREIKINVSSVSNDKENVGDASTFTVLLLFKKETMLLECFQSIFAQRTCSERILIS